MLDQFHFFYQGSFKNLIKLKFTRPLCNFLEIMFEYYKVLYQVFFPANPFRG